MTEMAGKLIVMVSWKYPRAPHEIRRKVYMDPDDYHLLRRHVTVGVRQELVDDASNRGVYMGVDSLSTPVTTIKNIDCISSLQVVGHVEP
jgi:hypothetical protein